MSNKISVVAIVGLSAVCLGLLWNQQICPFRQTDSVEQIAFEKSPTKPVVEKQSRGTITVSSSDLRMFLADEYVVTFGIVRKNKDKTKAFSQINTDREKVLALFKKLNIDEKNVELFSAHVENNTSYVNGKQINDGFKASQSVKVILNSKDVVETLEQELTQLPFVDDARIGGRLKDAEIMEVETIKSACKKAKQKADEYAQSVGTKVGTAIMVSGSSGVYDYNLSDSVRVTANVHASMRLLGKNESKNSYIMVNQREVKKFLADKFVIAVHIKIDGNNKETLYKLVAEKRAQIKEITKNLGIAETDVEIESMSIAKKQSWELRQDGDKNPIKASQRVVVNFRSKEAAAAFYVAIAGIENVFQAGAEPALNNEDSLRIQVTNLAGQKALARAKALAEGFGGKMGDVADVADVVIGGMDYAALDEIIFEDEMPMLNKSARGIGAGLSSLLGGGGESMNIADSVEISSFISVVTELKY